MTNDVLIQQWKLGKLKIDITKLSNEDKVRYVRTENLLGNLIQYYEKQKELKIQFDEGRFKNEKPKEETPKTQEDEGIQI